jgi:hypothetical protein
VAKLHSKRLPAVRLPPDRDWAATPLPAPDASSSISGSSLPVKHNSAACYWTGSPQAACLAPGSVPTSREGFWMRLLTAGCMCSDAAAGLQPHDSGAVAAGRAPASGWPPCCGSETILSGSISETLSPPCSQARLKAADAVTPTIPSGSSNAASKQLSAPESMAAQPPKVLQAGAETDGLCRSASGSGGDLQAACRRRLTADSMVTICWRCKV